MQISSRQGKFEPLRVNYSARSGGLIGISFLFSLTLRYVVCSHQNRPIEAILMSTHNITFSTKKENHPKRFYICSYGIFSKGPKNEFETAMVNEPSVLKPLKFFCIYIFFTLIYHVRNNSNKLFYIHFIFTALCDNI